MSAFAARIRARVASAPSTAAAAAASRCSKVVPRAAAAAATSSRPAASSISTTAPSTSSSLPSVASQSRCSRRRVPAAPQAAPWDEGLEPPTAAETARTIVDITAHGTLCTSGSDGVPLGTYASYVLDPRGQPLLRLRADAVHTASLRAHPRCSLFVQPPDRPGRLLARATLIGVASPLSPEESAEAAARHAALHGGDGAGRRGVDTPRADDLYHRLEVERCFFVAGLGGASDAAVLSGEEYAAASPDELRRAAPALAAEFNADRAAEVARIAAAAAGVSFDDLGAAELLWVDEAGCWVWASFLGGRPNADGPASSAASSSSSLDSVGGGACLRVPFPRRALDERDARSALTMLSQLAWEAERQYVPPLPAAVASAEGVA